MYSFQISLQYLLQVASWYFLDLPTWQRLVGLFKDSFNILGHGTATGFVAHPSPTYIHDPRLPLLQQEKLL